MTESKASSGTQIISMKKVSTMGQLVLIVLLATSSAVSCAAEELTLELAKQRAHSALINLEEVGFKFETHDRSDELAMWSLGFRREGERATVHLDLKDGVVYAVKFSGLHDALKGQSKGVPNLTAPAARSKAEIIARRFAGTTMFRVNQPTIPFAHSIGSRGLSSIYRAEVEPIIEGYPVHGWGCSIEFDRVSGRVVAYAGKWNLPPRNPAPKVPLTKEQAVAAASKTYKKPTNLPMPNESWLAFVSLDGRPLTLTWYLKYTILRSKYSFHIDAGTGQVLKKTTYK